MCLSITTLHGSFQVDVCGESPQENLITQHKVLVFLWKYCNSNDFPFHSCSALTLWLNSIPYRICRTFPWSFHQWQVRVSLLDHCKCCYSEHGRADTKLIYRFHFLWLDILGWNCFIIGSSSNYSKFFIKFLDESLI